MNRTAIVTLVAALALPGCATAPRTNVQPIPEAWLSVPAAPRIGSLSLADDGTVAMSVMPMGNRLTDGAVHAEGGAILLGDKTLAQNLGSIDSLDLSEVRSEVAFSAKPKDDFDIGLVATAGGEISWMPRDPADEVNVQWAPRGHKISYVIRASGGDIVRTLHIPTAYQFAVPFPNATINTLAWDPKAERYAVSYSTITSSDQVEVLDYKGETRRMVAEPKKQLDVEATPFAPGAVLLRPHDIRYDEQLPLVVWLADSFAWSDARAQLLATSRVAIIVATRTPDADFWRAAEAMKWLDAKHAYLVGSTEATADQVRITADPTVATGTYVREGNVVRVGAAVVQSFAAGFIAEQLERDHPTNGSSR